MVHVVVGVLDYQASLATFLLHLSLRIRLAAVDRNFREYEYELLS